jgi:hypothetical protein
MWRTRAIVGGLTVVLLCGCGADHVVITSDQRTSSGVAHPVTPTTEAAPAITPDTAALAAIDRDDGTPLTTNVRLRAGSILLEPPARDSKQPVNLATARAATRIEADAPRSAPLTCRLGMLTENVAGGDRLYDHQPAWMCIQMDVVSAPSNGPRTHANIVTFIDANTGHWLLTTEDST